MKQLEETEFNQQLQRELIFFCGKNCIKVQLYRGRRTRKDATVIASNKVNN